MEHQTTAEITVMEQTAIEALVFTMEKLFLTITYISWIRVDPVQKLSGSFSVALSTKLSSGMQNLSVHLYILKGIENYQLEQSLKRCGGHGVRHYFKLVLFKRKNFLVRNPVIECKL